MHTARHDVIASGLLKSKSTEKNHLAYQCQRAAIAQTVSDE